MMVFGLAGWAFADMLVVDNPLNDTGLTDVNPLYWVGSDANPAGRSLNNQLVNSNPITEEAWLEALLGKEYNDPSISYADRILAGEGGLGTDDKSLTNFNPGFAWGYAVVKYDGYWAAFEDTDGYNLLSLDGLPNGISHITFFDSNGHPNPVPEPVTMFLLGSGLIGLAGFARRKFRK